MPPILRKPLDVPAAWMGEDEQPTDRWIHHLTGAEVAELDAALATAKATGKAFQELTPGEFPLPALQNTIREWMQELQTGRGFILVRGLPVERYSLEDAATLYWGIGMHMGEPVSQNAAGDLLGHVRDTGADSHDPAVRLYKTRAEQPFHTDGADIIGLLCLRQGKSGGESRIVSSVSVYNEVLRRRPDLIDLMYEPFYFDSHEQQAEGQQPYFTFPLCWHDGGMLRTFYIPWYITQAQRHPDVPRLTPQQQELLALIDGIAGDPRFHLRMDFQPGDMQFLKNSVILHGRAAYEDYDEPERKRHLLRLWLTAHDFADGDAMLRAGVPAKAGVESDAATAHR